MALLDVPRNIPRNIRRFLSRKPDRGAAFGETATQADGLLRSVDEHDEPSASGDGRSLATVEPKLSVNPRSRSMQELQRSYDQVMELVRRIGDHLDAQAERQERLDVVIERLPEALERLPELCRQNEQILQALDRHHTQAAERDQGLTSALAQLGGSSQQQSEMLSLLHQQLDAGNRTSQSMVETLGDFRSTLTELGASNRRSVDVLADMAAAAERRESKLESILGRTQKWMIAALVCCGIAVIAALVIALV